MSNIKRCSCSCTPCICRPFCNSNDYNPITVCFANRCNSFGCPGPFSASVNVVDTRGIPVCGAKVILTNPQLRINLSAITNCSGRINFRQLPAGRYIATLVGINGCGEPGRNVSVRFELNRCNPSENICLNTGSLICSGRIIVKLVDKKCGKPLAGGKFILKTKDGEFISKQTTNEKGKAIFTNLPLGDYILKQVKAPHGFSKDTMKYCLSLTRDNKCQTITITNKKKRNGCACLCLSNCETCRPICGAEFAIYDKYESKIDCAETNRKGCLLFKGLTTPGEYIIKQLTTEHGYERIKKPICIELGKDDKCVKIEACNHKRHCRFEEFEFNNQNDDYEDHYEA